MRRGDARDHLHLDARRRLVEQKDARARRHRTKQRQQFLRPKGSSPAGRSATSRIAMGRAAPTPSRGFSAPGAPLASRKKEIPQLLAALIGKSPPARSRSRSARGRCAHPERFGRRRAGRPVRAPSLRAARHRAAHGRWSAERRPQTMLMSVVLPAPLGPMQAVTWPGGIGEADVLEDMDAAEIFGQPFDAEAAIRGSHESLPGLCGGRS